MRTPKFSVTTPDLRGFKNLVGLNPANNGIYNIPVPDDLKHSKAEVIILPLEAQPFARQQKSTLKFMLDELAAINEIEPIEMECPNRVDRENPFLNEDL